MNQHDLELLNEELTRLKEQAETASRLKTSLLMNMSHELRTPLNGILGFAGILSKELKDPEQRNMAQLITISAKRLSHTLNSIMDLAQVESLNVPVRIEITDLGMLAGKVIRANEFFFKDFNALITTRLPEGIQTRIDKRLVEKIIFELTENALKFTDKGTVDISVYKETGPGKSFATLTVKDSGRGISREKLDFIFEPFRQGSEGVSRSHEGSGLGLTLIQKYLPLFDGTLEVESEPGIGSSFTIRFPLYIPEPSARQGTTEVPVQEPATIRRKPSVLIVEDNKINQILITDYLKGKFETQIANNGNEALTMVSGQTFDVILMDINLGDDMDGLTATRNIRAMQQYASVPIIAVTGYSFEQQISRILSEKIHDILVKPFDQESLISLINKSLDKKKSEQ